MNHLTFNPCTTNERHQEPDAVYHLYNRLAHSVRLLDDEDKDDFIDRVRRVAEFSGIKLLSWCVMTNHFHLLVYLPERPCELSYEEFERRASLLLPSERAVLFEKSIAHHAVPPDVLERLYNIGVFMKIVKENFTLAYNERHGHHGTMWEGPYKFKRIPMDVRSMSTVAAYHNLNPVRACMVGDYTSYRWTSFAAATAGDKVALDGLHFIFENILDPDEVVTNLSDKLVTMMQQKMDRDLEAGKLEIAEAVWRKRLANQNEKLDPLTNEAMLIQVEERMAKLQSNELHDEMAKMLGRPASDNEVRIVRALAADPQVKTDDLSRITGIGLSYIKKLSGILQQKGIISREGTKRRSIWRVNLFRGE